MTLGDWDQGTGASIQWIFFFAASLFNLIIMLNLLIAIISETHARVTEISSLLKYQELADMISDFLFFDNEKNDDGGKLLLMIFEKEAAENFENKTDLGDIMEKFENLEK